MYHPTEEGQIEGSVTEVLEFYKFQMYYFSFYSSYRSKILNMSTYLRLKELLSLYIIL